MACVNCFNGCTETISDQCIKYTGIDIPSLEIAQGDSLSSVEQSLVKFLISTLDGSGIIPSIPPQTYCQDTYCELVKNYLPTCGEITIVDLFVALIKSVCDLQGQIDEIDAELLILNANYIIGCLSDVTTTSDTHTIVQAIITKLCQLQLSVTALTLNLDTNYSSNGTQLNAYLASYLAETLSSTLHNTKMIPFTILPYYGSIAGNFDGTGAGLGNWSRVFLCNGNNSTPDMRGRIPVGITDMSRSDFPDPNINPSITGNPAYALTGTYSKYGTNLVTLTVPQIPSHIHTATTVISPNPHAHTVQEYSGTGIAGHHISAPVTGSDSGTSTGNVTLSATTIISSNGGGQAHSNIQPVLAVYYIIYIP